MVGQHESLHDSPSAIMVAINGTKGSIFALKWALNTFSSEGKVNLMLFHVRQPITMIPTPNTLEKSLLPQNYSFQILSDDSTTDVKSVDSGSPCSILHRRSVSSYSVDDGRSLSCPTLEVQCSTSKMSSYRNYRVKVKSWDSGLSSLSNDSSGSSFPGNEKEIAQLKDVSIREVDAKAATGMLRKRQTASDIGLAFEKEFIEEASVLEEADYDANLKYEEQIRQERTPASDGKRYNTYTWEEIKSATSSFSDVLKLGEGANGTVYMGTFHHTTAAVKIIKSNEECETKQFKQELEILSRIHHPHILMLLGACPERGCLVYEYMENGSLDDRLKCKNNTPPLPWHYRLRIAWEMASALVFLHSKPVPIVHRDLKPANILLNEKYVSKIGDAGLSTLVPSMNFSMATLCKDTAPVGTFFYIDPEYQRTGMLSPKSDTYALGMVILELLTAKPPMGLAHSVEMALEDGNLMEVLDPKAGEWPIDPAQELAFLGISCLELRRKDRPDLKDHALPVLERLKEIAENAVVKPCFTT